MKNSKIISAGSLLPGHPVTNFDLTKTIDTSNEWIVERTGIKQRYLVKDELTSDLAAAAGKIAIKNSDIDSSQIGVIIVATTTPDRTFPSTATIVQQKLGLKNAFSFDVQAVCSGFVYALSIADKFIKTGQVKSALVIGAETLSKIIDWKDRTTCVLFGDGAGAVILAAADNNNEGILKTDLYSDGNHGGILQTSGGVSFSQNAGYIEMAGKEVFKHAVSKMSKSIKTIVEDSGLELADIDWIIPHQANARILSAVAKKLQFSEEKIIMTVDIHSNTSAASIPLALDFAIQGGKIKKGDIIVLEALGGGLTWGSILLKW
ncbi:ketoacyl-ACP synthase III [Flavobacteriaceae bacterium]|nr:ketoacyl-ACP synthase III [Flavobacteriaceae bacterium]